MQQFYEATPRHSPVRFYLCTLLYMCAALLLRALALAPLVSLWLFPAGSQWQYLALLCPVLLLFIVLPLRFSFAQALIQKSPERYFSFRKALGFSLYGKKLVESWLHALNVLKWAIPLAAVLGYGYYSYQTTPFTDLISAIETLGKDVTRVYASVLGFLTGASTSSLTGTMAEGLYAIAGIVGIAVLFLLLGVVRNSAFRYIWALSIREGQSPRAEARHRLHGRRFLQLLIALINLALLAPFLMVLWNSLITIAGDLSTAAMMAMAGMPVQLHDWKAVLPPLLLAFVGLYFLLLPLRRILTAYFAAKRVRHAPENAEQPLPVTPGQGPIPAYVPTISAADRPKNDTPASLESPELPPDFPATDELPPEEAEQEDLQEPRKDVDSSAFTLGQ